MKKPLYVSLLLLLSMLTAKPALAVDGSQVQLRSVTVPGHPIDAIGVFDITTPDNIIFRAPGAPDLAIPYASIIEFSTRNEVKFHIGVAPAIAVGIVKKRKKQHFLSLSYRDATQTVQVVTFEISKQAPPMLTSLLQAKARTACERREAGACIPVVPAPRVPPPPPPPLLPRPTA
jgi:hypothetical protein